MKIKLMAWQRRLSGGENHHSAAANLKKRN